MLTVFFEKTVDFRSNECSPKSNLLFGEADISASKRLFAFSTSYIHYIDKSNRIITISSSAIAIAIDALIVMMVNAILYRSIKNVIKLIIKSQKIRNSFIELMLQFLLEKKLGRLILHKLFSKALHLANKPTALATMRDGLISDYISNIITQKHIILQKSNSLISAFSSIGGIIAFLLDLSDSNWDDSLVIQY